MPHDKALRYTTRREFPDEEFRLALPPPETVRKIQMTDRRVDSYPRYQSAARPVMLIVIVYGSAMITILP